MLLRVIPGQVVTAEPEATEQILQALNSIQTALVLIQADISRLGTRGVAMSMELDRLTTEVSETNTVMDSAITLLNGLSAQIRALKDDPASWARWRLPCR